ncbi:hypothetical protein [Arthrobacter sp. TMS1-12-1]
MTRNRASRAIRSLLCAAVPAIVAFVGLTAVIVGILAMHVGMGGHGSTSHHVAAPTPGTTTGILPGAGTDIAAGHTADAHAGGGTGHVHALSTAMMAAETAVGPTALNAADTAPAAAPEGGVPFGCTGDCADGMMLGMCALAMIAVGIAGLLTPGGRALLSVPGGRAPPALARMSRPAPAPSLTQLCISRT